MSFPTWNAAAAVQAPCCFPNGDCYVYDASTCQRNGGIVKLGCPCEAPPNNTCGKQACCYTSTDGAGHCADMTPDECLHIGGMSRGESSCCGNTTCPDAFREGACCQYDPSIGWSCDWLSEDDCASLGGEFHIRVPCEQTDCRPAPLGACCYGGSYHCERVTEAICNQGGGVWYQGKECSQIECAPPPPDVAEGCRKANKEDRIRADSPELWSLDLCHEMSFGWAIRPQGHNPPANPVEDISYSRGYFELVSARTMRGMEPDWGRHIGSACKHHYGKLVLDPADGYFRGAICSQPLYKDEHSKQAHILYLAVNEQPESSDNGTLEKVPVGMCAYVGMHHVPIWTEAHWWSRKVYCDDYL